MNVCTRTYGDVRTYVNKYVWLYANLCGVHVCMNACMRVVSTGIYTRIYVFIYIYIYMFVSLCGCT